jgi:alpha-beta hydrolase superfamily lysophospholipase
MKVLYHVGVEGDWGTFEPAASGIETAQQWLTMDDGTRLYCRIWRAGAPATLLLLHGLGAHGGWFLDMGNALAARGVNVWQVDHRGFGRSEGSKGHVRDYRRYLQDIDAVVDAIRAASPDTRLFVLGHSMGGIFATYYAAAHPEKIAGLVLLNPWIKDQSNVSAGTALAVALRGMFKSMRPYALAGGPEVMTANPEAEQLLKSDPYWVRAESASFFWQLLLMRGGVLKQVRRVSVPALVLQAEKDKSVIYSATEEAFRQLGSADKTWKSYPGYAHDAEFEPDRSAMDDDIASWIRLQTGAAGPS